MLYIPKEIYRELQWIKKHLGKENWRDTDFLRWLIHKLYNDLQSKILNESMGDD